VFRWEIIENKYRAVQRGGGNQGKCPKAAKVAIFYRAAKK